MKIGYIDTNKVKFLIRQTEEDISYAVEIIEIEIKTEEYMLSGGNYLDFDDGELD